MTSPTSPSGTPPPAAPPSGPRKAGGPPKGVFIAAGAVLIGALVAGAFVMGRRSGTGSGSGSSFSTGERQGPPTAGATVEGMPEVPTEAVKMDVPGSAAPAAVWVDVYAPGKVRDAMARNAWLKQTLSQPVGKGFIGGWAAFFGTTGEDLKADFKGAVLDVVAGRLLDVPFRAVWFSGDARAGTPAFILPRPDSASASAWQALDKVARRSEMTAEGCPGGEGQAPAGGFHLSRWLVAEQTLWAARSEDRLVLARHPVVVLQGLCTGLPKLDGDSGVDVEVGFDAKSYGREAQLLGHVLGLGEHTRLQFAVEGDRLVGKGIAGELMDGPARLDSAPLSDDLLRLIPEDAPVLLTLQLKLPASLEPDALKTFWKVDGGGKGPTVTRQVAVVWTPRGDSSLPMALSLLWGRKEDAPALEKLFTGGSHTLQRATLCNHVALASTAEELERLRRACEGKSPNLLNAAGPVVAGLRTPASVSLGVNLGRLLSGLTRDGYASEVRAGRDAPLPKAVPPEIEAARRDLESLPYLGLHGTVKGDALVPGGFGS
ncbi:hypothetical protein JGU66_05670 [Myxococcaceae bacterium JPH2]|nr:hypothetical protein [Myxococcaceae bacterium JPH2]